MPTTVELRKDLELLRHRYRVVPPGSEAEKQRRGYEENLILVQLECEQFRSAFRREFLMTKTELTEKVVEEKTEYSVTTTFNWEPFRDRVMEMIDRKEAMRIAYYTEQIQNTYTNATPPKNEQAAV